MGRGVLIGDGLVRSAATPGRGGLALALARSAMAGELGMRLDLDTCPDLAGLPADVALFSESAGRFVVTVAGADRERFRACMDGLACREVGTVTAAPRLIVGLSGRTRVDLDVHALKRDFKETLADV